MGHPAPNQVRDLFSSERQRLNNDIVRAADRMWRARSHLVPGWSDRKDEQLARTLTDGIQMVVVVPEHLIDGIGRQQARVTCDRAGSVEMEDLQTLLPPQLPVACPMVPS
jgi:hypothetical protein